MAKLTKRQKWIAIIGGLAIVCALSAGILYATGSMPGQTRGESFEFDPNNMWGC